MPRRGFPTALLLSAAVILAGCSSTKAPKPMAELTVQEANGYRAFQAHCGACHYDRRSEALHGPPLRGVFQKKYLPSGAPANDERVSATMLHGRGLMPGQPGLDDQEVSDLLAYLHTL